MQRLTWTMLVLLLAAGPGTALAQDAEGEAEAEADVGVEAEAQADVEAEADLGMDADFGMGAEGEAGGGMAAETEPAPAAEPAAGGYAEAEMAPVGEAEAEAEADRPGPLVLGVEFGGAFPKPFTELDAHFRVGVEIGYKLPFLDERLEVFLSSAYTPPNNEFTDGRYNAEIVQKELTFGLGPRFRFLPVEGRFNFNAAIGARLFLLETTSNGDAGGEEFAEFTEQSTQIGLFGALGFEVLLGPGAGFLDLDIGWADLPHEITGDVNTGNWAVTVGYRFFLL